MGPVERFVYVARHQLGTEVPLRHTLEHLPEEALAEAGALEFRAFVGSGYCVLEFALAQGDMQARFARLFNDPGVHRFLQQVAGFLEEGSQIARLYAAADRFHRDARQQPATGESVSSADLPLASLAAHWPKAFATG